MKAIQISARIRPEVKSAVERVCEQRGLVMSRFVEEALLDKLEELQDIEDLKDIRFEATRGFEDVVRELGLDEEI